MGKSIGRERVSMLLRRANIKSTAACSPPKRASRVWPWHAIAVTANAQGSCGADCNGSHAFMARIGNPLAAAHVAMRPVHHHMLASVCSHCRLSHGGVTPPATENVRTHRTMSDIPKQIR